MPPELPSPYPYCPPQSDWSRIYAAWRSTLGIPAADQLPFADSCPAAPGRDEVANWLTYTYDECNAAMGHITQQQLRALHATTAAINPLLYAWAQYYAMNPPPSAAEVLDGGGGGGGAASPPLPPDRGTSRGCPPQLTRKGCRCKDTWVYGGKSYRGCTTEDAAAHGGSWCAVDLQDGCTAPQNGWWDLCTPVELLGCTASPPPPPSPPPVSPPPPSPPPPPASGPRSCGPGTDPLAVPAAGAFPI